MIIQVTFRSLDCDALFQLAGIPNGTCTSSSGARAVYPDNASVPVRCWYLDELSSQSVQRSVQNNFADIYKAGKPGDVLDVKIIN
jgi:hypothetical protein